MTTLRYKDYQGAVEFEDGTLIVRILHIDDLVTATTDSAVAAQGVFEELVDDYIATCEEVGKEPCKPFKGSFNVRISPELHRQVAMSAADLGESMNALIAVALEAHIEKQSTKKAPLDRGFLRKLLEKPPVDRGYVRVESARMRVASSPYSSQRHQREMILPPAVERQQRAH